MLTSKGYRCDAEIGKAPTWHVCNRKASVAIARAIGGDMYYCEKHLAHIDGRGFKRATFAQARELAQ